MIIHIYSVRVFLRFPIITKMLQNAPV